MYSERIKKIRKELDLSVSKLSKKIDVPERTITSYENGRTPSLEFLTQLCKKLNVSSEWFLFEKGEMFVEPEYEEIRDNILAEVQQVLARYGIKPK